MKETNIFFVLFHKEGCWEKKNRENKNILFIK